MTNHWNHILTADEIDTRYALTAKLDPRHARLCREFYETRTVDQLVTLAHQAWNCNDADGYQLARSFAALTA